MKKILLLLCILLLIQTGVFANASDWAADDLSKAEALGFLSDDSGISDFTGNISREGFCKLGYDFLRCCVRAKVNHTNPAKRFYDCDNPKVLYLAGAGIISGRGNAVFSPDDTITREEAAAILHRMADFIGYELPSPENTGYYADAHLISQWALNDVAVMYEMGVMNGVSATEFSPKSGYTAEQAVSTMVRLFEYYEDNLLFTDGELKATADASIKYNTTYAWVEIAGKTVHKCSLSDYYGYFCYFDTQGLKFALLGRNGVSEIYDTGFSKPLFLVSGTVISADEGGITAELDGEILRYDHKGEPAQ